MRAQLLRLETSDQGTFGVLEAPGFSCHITELPWRDNVKQRSCIPSGLYECRWHKSPKFGYVYKVFDVPDRSEILIHVGNYAGDSDKGFKSNSYGCLLPSLKVGYLGGQKAGLLSLLALTKLVEFFNKQPFDLEIINAYDAPSSLEL